MTLIRLDGKLAAVLCDMDGVLADASDAMAEMPVGGWEWFHDQVGYMKPLDNGVSDLLRNMYRMGVMVLILTCRPARCGDATEKWLDQNGVKHHEIMLRPEGVKHQDWKRQAVKAIKRQYNVVLALDDNPDEIAMYRELDIPGLLVPSNDWAPDARPRQWKEEHQYG